MKQIRLVSLKESLKLVGVKRKFFDRNIRPHIKSVKLGKNVLFRLYELEDFINSIFELRGKLCEALNGEALNVRSYHQDSSGEVKQFTSTQQSTLDKCDKLLRQTA